MKHGAFIQFFSDLFKVEIKTVTVVARAIREAGYLTSGARGVNAPDMTVADAANMIISLLSGEPPSRVVKVLESYRNLVPFWPIDYEEDRLLSLLNPEQTNTAGGMLEAFLHSVTMQDENLSTYLSEHHDNVLEIEVEIAEHKQSFVIRIRPLFEADRELVFFDEVATMEALFGSRPSRETLNERLVENPLLDTGMRIFRSIGSDDFFYISRTFGGYQGEEQ